MLMPEDSLNVYGPDIARLIDCEIKQEVLYDIRVDVKDSS